MKPSDLPLMLSSSALASPDEQYPLDRIRMQKAVFMLVQRGPQPWRELYDYRPYNWGPYSSALNGDLGRLANESLVVTREGNSRYPAYVASPEGENHAKELLQALSPEEKRFVSAIRHYVTTRSFPQLLREVYAAYPDFATKSQFAG
jgi:uncharacterized protein YwgA